MPRSTAGRFALLTTLLATGPASGQPPVNERWDTRFTATPTAIAPIQGNYNQGTPLTLTWGFMRDGTPINDGGNAPNSLQTFLNGLYGNQATWQPLFQDVFDRWSSVSGLSYQFEAADDGATFTASTAAAQRGSLGVRADVRIGGKFIDGETGSNTLAYNYFPSVGDMVIDTGNPTFFGDTTNNSRGLRNVVSHEHGHGLGMEHVVSDNANFLMEPFIDTTFDGPQYHDILAAQHMYGDAREKSNAGLGNDTALLANSLGTLSFGSPTSIGNSARTLVVASSATDFVSIDSATDTDVYKFDVGQSGTVNVNLEALGFTYNLTDEAGAGNVPFDTRLRSDLTLALLGTDGTTVLQVAAAGGLGAAESIQFQLGTAGTYFVRVTGADNIDSSALDAQFYGLTLDFTPVPEPASVLLVAAVAGGGWHLRRRTRAGVSPAA
jgi:hypothetical protein